MPDDDLIDEKTPITCLVCDGTGMTVTREEDGGRYAVHGQTCWLCLGMKTVPLWRFKLWILLRRPMQRPEGW